MPRQPEFERLHVVLVAARNPLNIGAAARAMSNFGFSGLRLVNAYHVAFREARSAVGASELLATAEEYKSVADAVILRHVSVNANALKIPESAKPNSPSIPGQQEACDT